VAANAPRRDARGRAGRDGDLRGGRRARGRRRRRRCRVTVPGHRLPRAPGRVRAARRLERDRHGAVGRAVLASHERARPGQPGRGRGGAAAGRGAAQPAGRRRRLLLPRRRAVRRATPPARSRRVGVRRLRGLHGRRRDQPGLRRRPAAVPRALRAGAARHRRRRGTRCRLRGAARAAPGRPPAPERRAGVGQHSARGPRAGPARLRPARRAVAARRVRAAHARAAGHGGVRARARGAPGGRGRVLRGRPVHQDHARGLQIPRPSARQRGNPRRRRAYSGLTLEGWPTQRRTDPARPAPDSLATGQ
jgi:hypothetical protein